MTEAKVLELYHAYMKERQTMSATWRDTAKPIIASVLESTTDLSLKERNKALREAYPFGKRAHHPYKIWLDEIAIQTGRRTRTVKGAGKDIDPRQSGLFEERE